MNCLFENRGIFVGENARDHGSHQTRLLYDLTECQHAIMDIVGLQSKKDRFGDMLV